MLIPITLLWGVHINLRTKLELTGVFCLILFTMIVAIVKVVVTLRTPREDDSWLFAWSAIESAVGSLQHFFTSPLIHTPISPRSIKSHANVFLTISYYHRLPRLLPRFIQERTPEEEILRYKRLSTTKHPQLSVIQKTY